MSATSSRPRSGSRTTSGIAGTVFTTGESIKIPYAYADLRFNPAFDRQTGYLHPLDPLRARLQQGRHGHRRHAGAEQARRPVHRRGREPPAGVHGADRGRPREREAVRRRADDEELQRVDAREHVERRDHVRRGGRGADLQRRGGRIAPARGVRRDRHVVRRAVRRRERLAARAHGARGRDARHRVGRWTPSCSSATRPCPRT